MVVPDGAGQEAGGFGVLGPVIHAGDPVNPGEVVDEVDDLFASVPVVEETVLSQLRPLAVSSLRAILWTANSNWRTSDEPNPAASIFLPNSPAVLSLASLAFDVAKGSA